MSISINNSNPEKIVYKGKPVKEVQYQGETVWSIEPSLNIYKLKGGYGDVNKITEYNSHNIFYFEGNYIPDYMQIISESYDSGHYATYANGVDFLYCDNKFYDYCIPYFGSAGHGQNATDTITFEYTPFSQQLTGKYMQVWYRSYVGYTIDGSYSTKVIHLSPNGGSKVSVLGKYLQFLGTTIEGWHESGRAQTQSGTAAQTYDYYYSIVTPNLQWYTPANKTSTKPLLNTEKIITSVSPDNYFEKQVLTFSYGENNTDDCKIQCLTYAKATKASQIGYLPNTTATITSKHPLYIFVQDSKKYPFIYWAYCINPAYIGGNPYIAKLKNSQDISLQSSNYAVDYDLDHFNFASLKTINEQLDGELNQNILLLNPKVSQYYKNADSYTLTFNIFVPENITPKFHISIKKNSIIYQFIIPNDLEQLTPGTAIPNNDKLYYHYGTILGIQNIIYNDINYNFYSIAVNTQIPTVNTAGNITLESVYLEKITF